jgi:hypothetical protein
MTCIGADEEEEDAPEKNGFQGARFREIRVKSGDPHFQRT